MILYDSLERGGVQNVVMQIVRRLHGEYTFDAIVFDSALSYYDEEFESYGGKIFRFGRYDKHSTFHARGDFYLRPYYIYRNVARVLMENGPYIVMHCNNGIEAGLCVWAATQAGVPIRIAHAHTSFENGGNILFATYSNVYLRLIKKYATHLIGCSKLAIEKNFGMSKGIVIGNGVDLNEYSAKNHLDATDDTISLLQIATYSQNKNQLFSLNVLKALKDKGVNAHLTLFGRSIASDFSGYCRTLQDYIIQNELNEYVQFISGNSSVPEAMKSHTFLLFPSLREGFGIVPVEAQAAGLHCFVSDTVPRDVDCGGCTFLPLKAGAEKWADAIVEEYQSSKGKANTYNCSQFSVDIICKKYQMLYEGKAVEA